MTPELATAVVLVAVMVVVAIIVRNVRDRSSRQQAHRAGQTAALGAATMDADLVQRRLEGRPAPVGPTRIVVAGQRPPVGGLATAAAGVDDLEPPRVQLIRDASAVGIAIIVVLLIGPTIFASRTGAVLGETSPPEGAVAPSGELDRPRRRGAARQRVARRRGDPEPGRTTAVADAGLRCAGHPGTAARAEPRRCERDADPDADEEADPGTDPHEEAESHADEEAGSDTDPEPTPPPTDCRPDATDPTPTVGAHAAGIAGTLRPDRLVAMGRSRWYTAAAVSGRP